MKPSDAKVKKVPRPSLLTGGAMRTPPPKVLLAGCAGLIVLAVALLYTRYNKFDRLNRKLFEVGGYTDTSEGGDWTRLFRAPTKLFLFSGTLTGFFHEKAVTMHNDAVTDSGFRSLILEHASTLQSVDTVSLQRTQVEDDSIKLLGRLPALEHLSLVGNTKLTDEAIKNVAAHCRLTALSLEDNPSISEGAFVHLKEIRQLEILELKPPHTTRAVLEKLGRLPAVFLLRLEEADVQPGDLTTLVDSRKLQSLALVRSRVADGVFDEIRDLKQLNDLSLDGSTFSFDALEKIEGSKTITWLHLCDSPVSREAAERLVRSFDKTCWLSLGSVGDEPIRVGN